MMVPMETDNPHTRRIAFLLALGVVALVIVSIDHLRTSRTEPQQAAVLKMYAQ